MENSSNFKAGDRVIAVRDAGIAIEGDLGTVERIERQLVPGCGLMRVPFAAVRLDRNGFLTMTRVLLVATGDFVKVAA
jgi:hypothetical protein